MSIFYVVATPIGNLEDISSRALRILAEADLILCEDTRVTKKLLERYSINTPTLSYHQHSLVQKIDYIIELLKAGKNLALVSDAGTPGISDPGNKLIEEITAELKENVKIEPIPGPSALIAALSASGFPTDKFFFLGFAPVKNKRKKFFEEIVSSKYPVVFYESPHRIIKTLNELGAMNGKISLVVFREITKKFETSYRGTPEEILGKINPEEIRGEFTVVAYAKK